MAESDDGEWDSVVLEISYLAQMHMSWPDLVALAQWQAEKHGAPPNTPPKIVQIATSRQPAVWLFRWRKNAIEEDSLDDRRTA